MKYLKKFNEMAENIDYVFQIFGSENSQDYDVMIFVDDIPQNIDAAHNICKHYNAELSNLLSDKVLNCNLAVLENGHIVKVFKGTADEVNNALYYTYDNHKQYFDNQIKSVVQRDTNQKLLRVCRGILSFYSRSHLRTVVKPALRGDLRLKLPVIRQIDFVTMTDFPGKKESIKDIYKVMAFQFGQFFSLIDGNEPDSYTKSGIIKHYPDLEPMLNRKELTESNLQTLNTYKEKLLDLAESRIDTMPKLVE
jgi:hypothetical protein